MGRDIDARVGISSTFSLQQSSDLEKTQAELRQTFNAAEKYRRELEYLQKGGNPLDLKCGSAASVSVQSMSLTDQHPEQFVASEAKGSFSVTASPHGDSVGSSGRLGGHLIREPYYADNLVLLNGDNKFPEVEKRYIVPLEHYSQLDSGQHARAAGDCAALELPKKSYKRRIRSRPNRDGARSSYSRDVKGLVVPNNASMTTKNFVTNISLDLDTELDGALAVETTPFQVPGSSPAISDTNGSQKSRRNQHDSTKCLDSESSCTQKGQSSDVNNEKKLPTSPRNIKCNEKMEQNLASNEVSDKESDKLVEEKECKIFNSPSSNFDSLYVEESKRSESALQNGLKSLVLVEGVAPDGSTCSEEVRKPCGELQGSDGSSIVESTLSVRGSNDVSELPACSQNNVNLATKEHEDSILKEAHIIEEKLKRLSELSFSTLPLQNQSSHWDLVLEEMSWLANDFAQERLWKVTAAAQISRQVAIASHIRYQQCISLQKQKEVAQTLGRDVMEFWHTIEVKCKDLEFQCLITDSKQGLQGYAMRFLEYNNTHAQCCTTQVSLTNDTISDVDIIDIAWDVNLTEENLVYLVPPGSIEAYRKSIESYLLQCERTWSDTEEEVDISGYDAVADHDGGTRAYYFPGAFEGSKALTDSKKRRKSFKLCTTRSYEMGADLPFMQSIETNVAAKPSALGGKRSDSCLDVSPHTEHVYTASRQRVIRPVNAPNKTDACSGDTDSREDEKTRGAQIPSIMDPSSVGDFEKQLRFDTVEVSDRPRKKKKTKHPGSLYNHRWQFDSNCQSDQKNHSERRPDARQLGSNESNGSKAQHNLKKLKIRHSLDDRTPLSHSIPSPVTSQMSNLSNPKKFIELLVRDRVKESKIRKMLAGQPGSGSLWSLSEDQFLVVMVHDMGPNWELISDAISSSLQVKRIYRSSKDCKERHKMLMDRSTGDGADSAEDSGTSQPYPSTLRGIPEGSARQLFQRLQGPTEEETLKSHFEKIIMIRKKQYNRRKQNGNQDPKQLQQPHSSHKLALSQVSPNNLNGGAVLTPVDLYDATAFTPDVPPIGYQGSHSGGLPTSDQGNDATMLPGSNSSSILPGSSSLSLGNDFTSALAPLNPSIRDGKYVIPRAGSLPKDDQQRMQHNNCTLSGSHSGVSRGVHVPFGDTVKSGTNSGMTVAGPAFNGVASPSTLNPVNMHSRAGASQGSSILRPRDPMHRMTPNHNSDHQKQMPQVSQGQSSQGVPQFGTNSTPPAFGMPFAKERLLQQQHVLQHERFPTSSAMMPHVQPPKSQFPVSPSQIQSQKHLLHPPHGIMLNPQTGDRQMLKPQSQSHQFQELQQKIRDKLQKQKLDNGNYQNHIPSLVVSSRTMPHQKSVDMPQVTSAQKMVYNQLVNTSESTTSKLQVPPVSTSNK